MIHKISLLLLVGIKLCYFALAQNNPASLKDIKPLSPNAASIQRFGDWPVGHATGIPSINIPLFQIQSGKLSLPVSLSYHAGGMRMNDLGSSVGMNWSLNAGGIINRSMMGGQPDDRDGFGFWDTYPIDTSDSPPLAEAAEYERMIDFAAGKYDCQPDVFSYNFGSYSGKFLFDHLKNISAIPYTNLKITGSYYAAGASNPYTMHPIGEAISGFTIVGPDGTTYFFLEPQYTKTESITYDKFAGELLPEAVQSLINEYIESYVKTWYLTLIVSADKKDSIKLDYDYYEIQYNSPGAVVKTIAAQLETNGIPQQLNSSSDRRTVIKNKIQEKWLKKIIFRNGYLQFYQNTNRNDLNGGKKLDSVVLYNSSGEKIKGYLFNHRYLRGTDFVEEGQLTSSDSAHEVRLFLTGLREAGSNSTLQEPYEFTYEHSLALPTKDRAGGDFWGFANGNTWYFLGDFLTLIGSTQLDKYNNFSDAQVNFLKHPNFNYAKQGILTQIKYPTGGYSKFEYEPNSGPLGVISIPYELCEGGSANIFNADFVNNSVVGKIRISNRQPMAFGQIIFLLLANYNDFPSHYVIEIRDSATNQLAHSFSYNPTDPLASCSDFSNISAPVCKKNIGLSPGTYLIKAKNNGQAFQSQIPDDELLFCYISTSNFNCHIDFLPTTDSVVAGGLRVKQITDVDSVALSKMVKKYAYGDPFRPEGLGQFITQTFHDFCGNKEFGGVITQYYSFEGEKALSTSSAYSLVDLNGSHIKYGLVKESVWDPQSEKENGFNVYKFNVFFDDPGFTNYDMFPYPPFTGDSWMVGQPEAKYIWKSDNDTTVLVQSEEYRYSMVKLKKKVSGEAFFQLSVEHSGENINPGTGDAYPCPPKSFLTGYSEFISQNYVRHQKFDYSSNFNLLDSTITKIYDDNATALVSTQAYEYDTATLLTKKISTTNSLNEKIVQEIKYASDFSGITSSDALSQGIKRLKDENVIDAEIEKSIYKSNLDGTSRRLISSVFTSFKSDISLPADVKIAEFTQPLTNFALSTVQSGAVSIDSRYKTKVNFDKYDSDGNLIEQQKENDVKMSYIWDYNKVYPIAECVKAEIDSIAYTSFEAEGSGNWNINSTTRNIDGITGNRCYEVSNGISRTGLNAGSEYILTYWRKSITPFSISGTQETPIKGRSVGDWTCFMHRISGVSEVSFSGSGLIDELRLYPKGAQITTYTFDPLIGMTSQCDVANKIAYYEYDSFGRLKLIRDQDKNILKSFEYKYQANTNQ